MAGSSQSSTGSDIAFRATQRPLLRVHDSSALHAERHRNRCPLQNLRGQQAGARQCDIQRTARAAFRAAQRSEEHTSEIPSLMRNSHAVFTLKQNKAQDTKTTTYYKPLH